MFSVFSVNSGKILFRGEFLACLAYVKNIPELKFLILDRDGLLVPESRLVEEMELINQGEFIDRLRKQLEITPIWGSVIWWLKDLEDRWYWYWTFIRKEVKQRWLNSRFREW